MVIEQTDMQDVFEIHATLQDIKDDELYVYLETRGKFESHCTCRILSLYRPEWAKETDPFRVEGESSEDDYGNPIAFESNIIESILICKARDGREYARIVLYIS